MPDLNFKKVQSLTPPFSPFKSTWPLSNMAVLLGQEGIMWEEVMQLERQEPSGTSEPFRHANEILGMFQSSSP